MRVVRTMTEAELLSNLKSGTNLEASVRALYLDNFESLSWYVINNSGSRQDAEDIFQDVLVNFIDVVQKDKFRGESSIKTFLFSLNRHAWLNELKRRGRALVREEKFEKAQDRVELDAGNMIAQRESKNAVTSLLDKLGETCKKILMLFYFENASIKQILGELNYENEQVVRNKKYKCLKQLETMIAEDPNLKKNLQNLLHG